MNPETIKALKIVLDYVERYNKQDEEKEVGEAAAVLQQVINNQNSK